jgi:hypothetical protein
MGTTFPTFDNKACLRRLGSPLGHAAVPPPPVLLQLLCHLQVGAVERRCPAGTRTLITLMPCILAFADHSLSIGGAC